MAIDHKTITDSEKHTPKGYPDTGSPDTNHVYQYSGSALEFGLVDTGNIASSAVTTVKLDNGAVTTVKLDNGSVTNDKVDAGTLGAEKFQTGAAEDAWVSDRIGYYLTEYAATGKSITIILFDDPDSYDVNDFLPVEIPGTVTITRPGSVRVTYDYTLSGVGAFENATIEVYRNESMVAETDFDSPGTASHDISVSSGDVISFEIGAGSVTAAFISNRIVKATTDLSVYS